MSTTPQRYRVHELFHSFQGEGIHMGRPAFFIRLHGCPVRCPWCDSAGTWHPDYVPKDVVQMTAVELAKESRRSDAPFVVVTGGEPTIYDLGSLTYELKLESRKVHLETSGGFEIKGFFDWITLSPKKWKPPLPNNVNLANEFKFIIEAPEDIAFYFDMIGGRQYRGQTIWLHPEWSQAQNPAVLEAITEAVKKGGDGVPFRAGLQLHKYYRADSLDARSRPLVPLGGDPFKGH